MVTVAAAVTLLIRRAESTACFSPRCHAAVPRARSRDAAIFSACELRAAGYDVRRILDPNGGTIERAELDVHYNDGHFPGLHLARAPRAAALAIPPRPDDLPDQQR